MNQGPWQTYLKMCSKAALLLSLLVTGGGVALVVSTVGTPILSGQFRPLDYHFDVSLMTAILNIGFPIVLLSVAALAWFAAQSRAFRVFPAGLVLVAILSVFAPALAVWRCLVAIHGDGINLWS